MHITPTHFTLPHTDVPLLTIVNSSAITVQWNRSSSFPPNVAISYLLVIRNESDQFDLQEELFNISANFTSYPLSYQFHFPDMDNLGCYNVSFVILARSSDGENERPGRAVSGFPVGKSYNLITLKLAHLTKTIFTLSILVVGFNYSASPQISGGKTRYLD